MNPEFPAVFVEYAREKIRKDREIVEYMAEFGPSAIIRNWYLMSRAAAGDGDNGK